MAKEEAERSTGGSTSPTSPTAPSGRAEAPREVEPGAVLRAGHCLFLLASDLGALARPGEQGGVGIAGPFHAAPLAQRLRIASATGRSVLIEGETGSGKELAARAVL